MEDSCADDESKGKKIQEYDDLFSTFVSSFGRYQKVVVYSSCLLVMLTSGQFASLLFVYGTPNFHCQSDNSTATSVCPANKCCANCTKYVFDGPFKSIVSEWNLICDKAYIAASLQACFFAGMLVGGFVVGMVSDSIGRTKSTFIFVAILIISCFASVFSDCLSLTGFLRFLMGVGTCGNQTSHFTFLLELLGPRHRTLASSVFQVYFGIGYFIVCSVAYFIRDWRPVVLITSLPGILLFFFVRLYPESPRWLVSQNRLDEAQKTLLKCGKKSVRPEQLKNALEDVKNAQFSKKKIQESKIYTPLDLVRTPKLRKRSFFVAFNWFSVSFLGNALLLYIDDLSGNIYLNFTIINCLYPLAVISTWISARRLGRRLTHSGILFITGLLFLVSLAVSYDDSLTRTWIFVAGITTAAGLWITIFLIGTELFPTVLRSTAVGTGYTIGRFGAILAPYVGMIGQLPDFSVTLPLTIFGVVAITTSISALWLPETLNSPMHQTVEEEESAREDYSLPCCGKQSHDNPDVVANYQLNEMKNESAEEIATSL